MGFGFTIKKLREDAGISVEKLTGLIGVKATRWRKWEEKDLNPRDDDQRRIEDFFKTDIEKVVTLKSIKEFLDVPNYVMRTQKNMEGNSVQAKPDEIPTGQILTLLARAFDKQAETIAIQAKWLESIENNMARQDSQAILSNKVDATDSRTSTMESNLIRVLAGVEVLSQDQERTMKAIQDLSRQVGADKKTPSPGAGKKLDQTDGGVNRQGKKGE